MIKNGWTEIKDLRTGAVIVWEKRDSNGSQNWHIGFYVGDDMAMKSLRFLILV